MTSNNMWGFSFEHGYGGNQWVHFLIYNTVYIMFKSSDKTLLDVILLSMSDLTFLRHRIKIASLFYRAKHWTHYSNLRLCCYHLLHHCVWMSCPKKVFLLTFLSIQSFTWIISQIFLGKSCRDLQLVSGLRYRSMKRIIRQLSETRPDFQVPSHDSPPPSPTILDIPDPENHSVENPFHRQPTRSKSTSCRLPWKPSQQVRCILDECQLLYPWMTFTTLGIWRCYSFTVDVWTWI